VSEANSKPINAALDLLQRGFSSQFDQALRVLPGISLAEDRISRHHYLNSSSHRLADRVAGHASVNLDPEIGVARRAHQRQLAHLLQRRRNKFLPAKPRIH